MFKKILKLFVPFLLVGSSLYSDVNYLTLYNDQENSDVNGYWQMVGIAGFSQDEYKVVNDDSYFVKYINSDRVVFVEDSFNGTIDQFGANLPEYNTLMFAVKIKDNDDVESLVFKFEEELEVTPSSTTVDGVKTYIRLFGIDDDIEVVFNSQLDGKTLTFFLNQDPSTVYQITLDSTNMADQVTTASEIDPEIYIVKKNVKEVVDLYFYDNPSFGDNEDNINNFDSTIHQSFIRDGNDSTSDSEYEDRLRDESEIRIYSWNTESSTWDFYNSTNQNNDLTELQVGKGYWMRLKTIDDNNTVVFEVNETYFEGTDLNYSLYLRDANNVGNFQKIELNTTSDSTSDDIASVEDIIKEINDNQGANILANVGFNIYASKIANNQILLSANAEFDFNTTNSEILFRHKSPKDTDDYFQDLNNTGNGNVLNGFVNKAGLVLGDEHIKVSNHAIYQSIAKKGWNLLTLPTSPIRESTTGLIVEFDEASATASTSGTTYCLNIADSFNATKINVDLKDSFDNNASEASLTINNRINTALSSGDTDNDLNIRSYPLEDKKILFISDKKFTLSIDDTSTGCSGTERFGAVTNLIGETVQADLASNQTATSQYGEFGLVVRPNISSYFVDSDINSDVTSRAEMTINGSTEVSVYNTDPTATTFADAIMAKDSDIKAYVIDEDFDGNTTNGLILLASNSIFSVEDTTYTRVYKYTAPTSDSYITVYGSGSNQNYGDEERILANSTLATFADEIDDTKGVYAGVANTDYLIISSIEQDLLDVKESYKNATDILEDVFDFSVLGDDINHSLGALIEGYNLHDLTSLELNISEDSQGAFRSYPDFSKPEEDDINSHPFWTKDLVAENALIALADEEYANLMPRMIVGGITDTDTGKVNWEQLNTTKSLSTWYDSGYNYNLFKTNSQRAYWVYLDEPIDNTIEFETDNTTVTKRNIRHYNNSTGEVKNYLSLDVSATVNGLLNNGELEGLVYLSFDEIANLVGEEFILRHALQNAFKGSINSFEINSINEEQNLTTVKIIATNGRTHRKVFEEAIDIQKPTAPTLSFNSTPSTLTMNSTDESETGVIKYLVFQDAIDDIYGVGNDDEVKNLLATVTAVNGGDTTLEICSEITYEELNEIPLIVVALDDEDESKANVSNMSRINFAPIKNGTEKVTSVDQEEASIPVAYDDSCTETVLDTTKGVSLKSLVSETISVVYKADDTISSTSGITGVSEIMYVRTDASNSAVAQIKFTVDYTGETFYLYYEGDSGGKLYKGTFSTTNSDGLPTDTQENAVVLEPVQNGNFLGDGTFNTNPSDQSI
jgi:hypothetical protein